MEKEENWAAFLNWCVRFYDHYIMFIGLVGRVFANGLEN